MPMLPVEDMKIDEVAWAAPRSSPTMKYPLSRGISPIASQPLPPPDTHVPLMAKQPESISIPLDKDEVAESEIYEAVPMPSKVEAVNLGKVEVAIVEVAVK